MNKNKDNEHQKRYNNCLNSTILRANPMKIEKGVPHGSVLGLLLFIVHTKSEYYTAKKTVYVDDTMLP